MCLVGKMGYMSVCVCVCVGVNVCLQGVHTGAWCSQDARRMVSRPPRGQTRGSDTGHPPSARGGDTKGTKTHHTLCRGEGVWLPVSLQVSYTLLLGSHLTCFQGVLS